MAIDINSFELPINAEQAREILQYNTDNFGVFADLDRNYELQGLLLLELRDIRKRMQETYGAQSFSMDDDMSVIQFLTKIGVPKQEFVSNKKYSIAKPIREDILQNAGYSDTVYDIVGAVDTYSTAQYNLSILRSWTTYPQCVAFSKSGHRMCRLQPIWSILNTRRLQTSNPNLQGLSRDMPDVLTEPAGYTFVRCDSGQIEPRINFSYFIRDELIMNLIRYYDDAYFGLLHYCTMPSHVLQACAADFKANFKPIEITDAMTEKRQILKRLVNAGSYGSNNLSNMDPSLSRAFESRIQKHPKRLELEQRVVQSVESGVETFYSAFGTPVTPGNTAKYSKGDDKWYHHVIKCGINNPVQATAADLMLISINEANKILSEAKDSWIAYYKHDEAAFYVSDEDAANGFIDRLKDVTAYNVSGWLPIPADSLIGVKASKKYPTYL